MWPGDRSGGNALYLTACRQYGAVRLSELEKHLGPLFDRHPGASIDKQALDNSGRVLAFVYGEDMPVTIESPAYCDDLFVIIELCPAGTGDIRRKRLEKTMQLNAYALETRGAAIGWDDVGERIILTYFTGLPEC